MFFGSADSAEGLVYKIVQNKASLLSEEDFQESLKAQFPNCAKHYDAWCSNPPQTTWQLERAAQIMLFAAVRDSPEFLDYILLQTDPKPNQTLGFDDVSKGLEAVHGERMLYILGYMSHGREGFRKKCEMYER